MKRDVRSDKPQTQWLFMQEVKESVRRRQRWEWVGLAAWFLIVGPALAYLFGTW